VLARRDALLGRFDAMAVSAAAVPDALKGTGRAEAVTGNGWDALSMEANAVLELPFRGAGPIHLEIRVAGAQAGLAAPARRFLVRVAPASGPSGRPIEIEVPATRSDPWQLVTADVDVGPGDRLVLQAGDPLTVQSIRGFATAEGALALGSVPIPGWRVSVATPDAVVLEPVR